MTDAITLLITLIRSALSWVFSAEILSGVSIGWVVVTVFLISFLIRMILHRSGGSDNG